MVFHQSEKICFNGGFATHNIEQMEDVKEIEETGSNLYRYTLVI